MAISTCSPDVDELGRELTIHGSAGFPIGCYHDDLAREEVPWHWHEELEAAVVTEGETVLHVENRQFHLKAGDGFFINSGYLHACDYVAPDPCRFHSMSFHAGLIGGEQKSVFWERYLDPVLQDPQMRYCVLSPSVPWQKEILTKIEQTWQACSMEENGYEFTVRALLSDILLILRDQLGGGKGARTVRMLREDQRIKQMLSFMQEHCAENLTVEEIAESARISKSECLRVFHRTISMTPMKYLTFLRIRKAAHLLADTDQKIIDIGIACGFQDMSYFARVFKKEKGSTPGEYRTFAMRRDK